MDEQLIETLRSIGSNFMVLAEELEKHNKAIDNRLCQIEDETLNNKQALKDAAHAILGRLYNYED